METREIFVMKMRKGEENWGRPKYFCQGTMVLYFDNDDSSRVVKNYRYKSIYNFRSRWRLFEQDKADGFHYVHVIPKIDFQND